MLNMSKASLRELEEGYNQLKEQWEQSMVALYQQLKGKVPTDTKGRVYISDGIWLNPDGSLDDEGLPN